MTYHALGSNKSFAQSSKSPILHPMSKYYRDYTWKKGFPYGIEEVSPTSANAYKIPSDPYCKRVAVENWHEGNFHSVVYDSALLDFRHLQPAEQTAWQKVVVFESEEKTVCEIRNQDDRTLLVETYFFEKGLCRHCSIFSAHGIAIAQQQMLYKEFDDPFNGVILKDNHAHPVMIKRYSDTLEAGQFTDLIHEEWDMLHATRSNLCLK